MLLMQKRVIKLASLVKNEWMQARQLVELKRMILLACFFFCFCTLVFHFLFFLYISFLFCISLRLLRSDLGNNDMDV